MTLRKLVWRELAERPAAMVTGALAILLGVAALVAIRHVVFFSEHEVGKQLESLGANVLVLPKAATLQDYYAADLSNQTLPESHASRILLANLSGVERLSPRLCVPAKVKMRPVTLTGILPQSEFKAKAAWQSVAVFSNPRQCCTKASIASDGLSTDPESLVTERSIAELSSREVVLGADVAEVSGVKLGESIELLGEQFRVLAVLPPTGTVDDTRAFAHLHTVQRLAGAGEVVNAIEVIGCCQDAAGSLVPQLSELLPDAKVVTISQVVSTQVGVNRLMGNVSLAVLFVLIIVGGASVANTIASNVRERRREIGTMMAIGAAPRFIATLFLCKAWLLGAVGAVGGCALGIIAASLFGSQWAGVEVTPLLDLTALTVAGTFLVATLAALIPARSAALLDPCCCFSEI
jgi:putative ABC transport system permease protein